MLSFTILSIALVLGGVSAKVDRAVYIQPEQIHLSLGSTPEQMVVTWTTFNKTEDSTVWFGEKRLDKVAYGTQTLFTDGGKEKRSMYIHRVYLKDLKSVTEYRYHVGSREGISPVFFFTTIKAGSDWSPRLIVYGDLGNGNAQTMEQMQTVVQNGDFDLLLHVGDFAYDLHDDNARVGDEFMRQIESIAAYIPYQVCPGNHEEKYNFSNYNNRFTMHSEDDPVSNNFFWSYNIGPAHIISFSTEFYFFTNYGKQQIENQLRWLKADLEKANKTRAERPWIITMAHRPLYSQYGKRDEDAKMLRKELEDLFHNYRVDLSIWGHMHIYQRMYPVYQEKVTKQGSDPYTNPPSTVHIITGSAGCVSQLDPVEPDLPDYNAKIYRDYGFSKLTIHNATHLHWRQTAETEKWAEVDNIWIVKDRVHK